MNHLIQFLNYLFQFLKLILQSLIGGICLTVIMFVIVVIVDVNSNTGSASGINLLVRTPFAWSFFWPMYFWDFTPETDYLFSAFINIVLYSVLTALVLLWKRIKLELQ